MNKTAADVMQTAILSVSPDDPLHMVQRLFYEEGIHGAPVIDDQGRLRGIITSTDILRAATEAHDEEEREGASIEDLDPSYGAWGMTPEAFAERLRDTVVSDFMTEQVVQVTPDTKVSDVARSLRENQVHRVLVVERDKLCGLVSALDLVALLEEG